MDSSVGLAPARQATSAAIRAASVAYLFDLDGVLWETSDLHDAAFSHVCRSEGLTPVPYAGLAGRPTSEAWQLIAEANGVAVAALDVERLSAAKQSLVRQAITKAPPLCKEIGVVAALATGPNPVALVTGASAGTTKLFLEATRIAFAAVVTAQSVARGKPAPDPYLFACDQVGMAPSHCWVLEDSVQGLQSAQAAGTRVVHLRGSDGCALGHVGIRCVTSISTFIRLVQMEAAA